MQCSRWLFFWQWHHGTCWPNFLLWFFFFFFLNQLTFLISRSVSPEQNMSWAASGKPGRRFFLLFQRVEVRCSGTLFNPAAGSRERHDRKQNYQQWYAQTAFGIRNLRDSGELHLISVMWLQETSGVISRRTLAVKNVRLHKHTNVWCLAFPPSEKYTAAQRMCLFKSGGLIVWLSFLWDYCRKLRPDFSPLTCWPTCVSLVPALCCKVCIPLPVWAKLHKTKYKSRPSVLKCVNWTETHAAVVITRQRPFPTAWLHTCCPFRLCSQWKGFPRILT